MHEEQAKLIAKIQHFYDVMTARLNKIEEMGMIDGNEVNELAYKVKIDELNFLSFEYARTFSKFLYNEEEG